MRDEDKQAGDVRRPVWSLLWPAKLSCRPLVYLLLLLPFPVLAEFDPAVEDGVFPQQMNARQLLDACASSTLTRTGRERRRYCRGFVSGVEEAVRILKARHQLEASLCPPSGVSARALTDVFRKYAGARQDNLDTPAAGMVLKSLEEAYPCK